MQWDKQQFLGPLTQVITLLAKEPSYLRPKNKKGAPGGIVRLDPALPTVLFADLHGRHELIPKILSLEIAGKPLQQLLAEQRAQLVFLGDFVHGEAHRQERWVRAFTEFESDFAISLAMDEEMAENLMAWQGLIELKIQFPHHVHLLKGNHENVTNQTGEGNRAFGKFAQEGKMVKRWIELKLGEEILFALNVFEKSLPLLVLNDRFVASHAPPVNSYSVLKMIEAGAEVTEGLTWTRREALSEEVIKKTLHNFWGHSAGLWVAGHNPTKNGVEWDKKRALVHLHHADQPCALYLQPDKAFDLQLATLLL